MMGRPRRRGRDFSPTAKEIPIEFLPVPFRPVTPAFRPVVFEQQSLFKFGAVLYMVDIT